MAAENGHLEVLAWTCAQGCPCDAKLAAFAREYEALTPAGDVEALTARLRSECVGD